jgi:hypothetical protein
MFLGNLVLQLLDEVMVGVDAKRAGSRNSSPKNVTLKLYINRLDNRPAKKKHGANAIQNFWGKLVTLATSENCEKFYNMERIGSYK